jgi:hypothetical protein
MIIGLSFETQEAKGELKQKKIILTPIITSPKGLKTSFLVHQVFYSLYSLC